MALRPCANRRPPSSLRPTARATAAPSKNNRSENSRAHRRARARSAGARSRLLSSKKAEQRRAGFKRARTEVCGRASRTCRAARANIRRACRGSERPRARSSNCGSECCRDRRDRAAAQPEREPRRRSQTPRPEAVDLDAEMERADARHDEARTSMRAWSSEAEQPRATGRTDSAHSGTRRLQLIELAGRRPLRSELAEIHAERTSARAPPLIARRPRRAPRLLLGRCSAGAVARAGRAHKRARHARGLRGGRGAVRDADRKPLRARASMRARSDHRRRAGRRRVHQIGRAGAGRVPGRRPARRRRRALRREFGTARTGDRGQGEEPRRSR